MAATSSSSDPYTRPAPLSATISGIAPILDTMTGVPSRNASMSTSAKDS